MTRRTPQKLGPTVAAIAVATLLVLSGVLRAEQTPPAQSDTSRAAAHSVSPRGPIEKEPLRRTAPGAAATAGPSTQKAAARAPAAGGFEVGRVATALAVVVILILLLRWIAKRFFGVAGVQRSSRAVQVLSRSPLSPRQQLVLLRVGRRLLVVADGGGQMNTLSEITDADEVAALLGQIQDDHSQRATRSFGSLFGKMRKTYDVDPDAADAADAAETAEAEPMEVGGRMSERREEDDDAAVVSTRQELIGLMDKVKTLSRQFKSH